MTARTSTAEQSVASRSRALPREHGFWAMLGVAVLSAALRAPSSPRAWLIAVLVVALGSAAGAALGRRIRRSAALQVASSGVLAFAGVPIELAGGVPSSLAAADAAMWAAVFTASALTVRACFSRASRRGTAAATRFAAASATVPLLATAAFGALDLDAHAHASLVAAALIGAATFARPGTKQLRSVGIFLAAVTVVAAVMLRIT